MNLRESRRFHGNSCFNDKNIEPLNIGQELSYYEILLKLCNKINDILEQITEINSRLDEHDSHLAQIDESINMINSQLSAIFAALTDLQNQITHNLELIRDCQDDISSIEDDISTRIGPKLEELQTEIDNLTLLTEYDSVTEELTFSVGSEVE